MVENNPFQYFGENQNDGKWSVIFGVQKIIFLVKRDDLGSLPGSRKDLAGNRQIDDVSNSR